MKNPLYLCLSLVSFLSLSSSATADENEFLSKYSYPVFAVAAGQQYTGTSFFYRSGDSNFLVSNYHAIKGMSPLKQTVTFRTDTVYVKYPVANSGKYKLMAVDISEEITGATEIFSMVNRVDLFKIPVTIPDDANIYFINDLIDEEYLEAVPEEVVAFGFPVKPGSVPAFYSHQQRLKGKINPDGFADYDESLQMNFPPTSDSARAILNATSRYYYFIRPYAAAGYSGAPVFGKFRTGSGKTIFRFIGVIFAGQTATKQTWAIKGSVALQYLQGDF
jgi:hypothetical protein